MPLGKSTRRYGVLWPYQNHSFRQISCSELSHPLAESLTWLCTLPSWDFRAAGLRKPRKRLSGIARGSSGLADVPRALAKDEEKLA